MVSLVEIKASYTGLGEKLALGLMGVPSYLNRGLILKNDIEIFPKKLGEGGEKKIDPPKERLSAPGVHGSLSLSH